MYQIDKTNIALYNKNKVPKYKERRYENGICEIPRKTIGTLSDDRQSVYGDYQLAVNSEFAKGNGTFSF